MPEDGVLGINMAPRQDNELPQVASIDANSVAAKEGTLKSGQYKQRLEIERSFALLFGICSFNTVLNY